LKRIFIFLGIYLYLHTPRGAPEMRRKENDLKDICENQRDQRKKK